MEIPCKGSKLAAHTFAISKEITNIKLPIELGPWEEGSGTRSNGYEKGGRRPRERARGIGNGTKHLGRRERKTFHKGLPRCSGVSVSASSYCLQIQIQTFVSQSESGGSGTKFCRT